jgi:hypothetical protein
VILLSHRPQRNKGESTWLIYDLHGHASPNLKFYTITAGTSAKSSCFLVPAWCLGAVLCVSDEAA